MSTAAPDLESLRAFRAFKDHSVTRDQHDLRPQASGIEKARPVHADRVLVRRVDPPPDGRLVILPDADARQKVGHQLGVVVAVAGRYSFDVAAGDRVVYARWPANEFEQDGETFTFLYEEQAILCVLEGS